jgi:hypothetical protein
MQAEQVEELICLVSAMGRDAVMDRLLGFNGTFPVDFTVQFLDTLPVDRLRHILVALCLQTRRAAFDPVPTAA